MTTLALVLHHYRGQVIDLAEQAKAWCDEVGVRCIMDPEDAALIDSPELAVSIEELRAADVCLSLGGDGTILRAVQLVGASGVPIIGLNAGRLGYLTEFDPTQLVHALTMWQNDELKVDQRMLLKMSIDSPRQQLTGYALNEVVIERAQSGHTVSVNALINGRSFTTFLADGIIVSTPTGSTAYSLSAGGPIVEPSSEAILLTPVAAHMVFDRTMVLNQSSTVELRVQGYRAAAVTLDGRQVATLEPGESIRCCSAEVVARFLVTGERDFHAILKEKFGLSDR